MATEDAPVLVDRTDGVVTLTLNRPTALNAFDLAMKEQFLAALDAAAADPDCRALVLTGAGRAFCVGQDLKEHITALSSPQGPLDTVVRHFNPVAQRVATFGRPVVAAVRGMAAGAGASLAFLADFRVGGPGTAFLMAFANVGLAADTGASWTLPRLVGRAAATRMLMLAEPVPAAEADRLGLLTVLTPDDERVLPAAHELAVRLAAGPTVAYGQIRRQLQFAAGATLDDALAMEAEAQRLCGATADHRAATEAFVARQRPVFTGR
jgi:2-(1,2-epoxy-1,2-dihydrophenyl)acetyl-CoA isomerase